MPVRNVILSAVSLSANEPCFVCDTQPYSHTYTANIMLPTLMEVNAVKITVRVSKSFITVLHSFSISIKMDASSVCC
jgi:hypothetical protein